MVAGLSALLIGLPGCQSVTGSPATSLVRIIDASPDAPALDVYQGSGVLAYNLGLGTITSYVPITPGNYTVQGDTAGTKQALVSATGTFLNGSQYTVLIGNYSNALQELILKDQSQAATTGQFNVRFIDQATRIGALDVYLVPTGSTIVTVKPVLTNTTFNANSGYISLPAGTYTLVLLAAGTVPTATVVPAYTGTAVVYGSGSARTIVLIDQQLVTAPGVQAIIANDYDSPNATS